MKVSRHSNANNKLVHFIGPNPSTSFNPCSIYPTIAPSAFIGPFSSIIGDVTIKENVFIAPNVSIRADEGTPFYVGANTNIQDGVILHGLKSGRVSADGKKYSIFIGQGVSCAHGSLIHGPCKIKDNVFIGFNAIIFSCIIGEGAYISPNAVVTGGIKLAANRFVPLGSIIDTQDKADALPTITEAQQHFAEDVQQINREFPLAYSMMFGSTRCSCGLACDSDLLDLED